MSQFDHEGFYPPTRDRDNWTPRGGFPPGFQFVDPTDPDSVNEILHDEGDAAADKILQLATA